MVSRVSILVRVRFTLGLGFGLGIGFGLELELELGSGIGLGLLVQLGLGSGLAMIRMRDTMPVVEMSTRVNSKKETRKWGGRDSKFEKGLYKTGCTKQGAEGLKSI
jgi:hypothetical protein